MSGKVCHCGRGYVSAYDGKCGHCRNKKERLAHQGMIYRNWSKDEAEMGHRYADGEKA
jgi:hypothetical protein